MARTAHPKRRRFLVALFLPLLFLAMPLAGQAEGIVSVTYTGPDDYQVTRPLACPAQLTGGYLGTFFGYEHEGYEWTDDWQRNRVLDPVHHALAEYVPLGDPYSIVSRDGRARWVEPRVTVQCTIIEWWSRGRITRSLSRFRTIHNGGRVEPIEGSGCGEEREEEATLYAASYDPMSPEGGCGDGDDGSGGTEGSGTQYQPGDSTGGETVDWATGVGNGGESACGKDARVVYICIDIFNAETGAWEEWTCGYATTC